MSAPVEDSRVPTKAVAAVMLSAPEALRGGDGPEAQRWVANAAFAEWAVREAGLKREDVAAAESDPLAEVLILRGLLTLEQAVAALEPVLDVRCGCCAAVFPLGQGAAAYVGRVRCPRCDAPLEPPPAASQPRRVGPFEVLGVLGRGGMGAVYEARAGDGPAVALKVLQGMQDDDVARARFERERQLFGRIDHENVVRIVDSGVDVPSGSPYLALELVRGGDLLRLLDVRAGGSLEVGEACYVLAACARGLRHLHELGVLHRDVKPSNILITAAGAVKIADLGLAFSSDVSRRLTARGEVLGTPQYVAPEVVRGEEWSPACDVYSLGSCAYRLLAGEPAFQGKSVADVLEGHLSAVPPPLADVREDVPAALSDLVARMLAKDPAARPGLDAVLATLAEVGPATREAVAARWELDVLRLAAVSEATPSPEPTVQKGQVFKDYRLEEELGRGGMGVVYRAYHLKLKKTVALKVLLAGTLAGDGERRRFLREAEAAAALQHPAIVPVLDAGEHEGTYYLTLEFVQGVSLSAWYGEHPDLAGLLRLFLEVCDAVHHAHSRGVIHRDLKPENVIVDAEGRPHILDFGIAKRVDRPDDEEAAALTTEGDIIGTLRYMPPEQAAGRAHQVDVRSDVYALGSMLYELVTLGTTPFRGGVQELLQKILFEEPRAPSAARPERQVPWELDAICLKTLEKDRDDRYQSALELRRDVERFLEGRPISARQASLGYRARKWVARNRARLLVGGLVAALVLGLLGAWQRERGRAERRRQDALRAAAREGWALYAGREFDAAAVRFKAGADLARPDDALALAGLELPPELLEGLAEDERASPRVTRDRLGAWARLAQGRIRAQQADEYLAAARRALSSGALDEATRAVLAARLLTEEGDGRALAAALVERWDGQLGEALAAFDAAATVDARQGELARARGALGQARSLAPDDPRVTRALFGLQEREARLQALREQQAAFDQAQARLREALALEARADQAPAQAADLLRQARVRVMAALERWPTLEAARDAATRIAVRLGDLALAADALDVAELELSHARLYGLRGAEVDALEQRLRARDRRLRAFTAQRLAGDGAFARGALAEARSSYDLALAERDDEAVRRRRDLCDALLEAEAARARGAAQDERAALRRAAALDEHPERFAADLARLEEQLYREALAQADEASRAAAVRGAGWQEVAALYERALRFHPDGDEAWSGRADAYAERDRPADMVLVSVPLRLVARGPAASRVGAREALRFYVDRVEVSTADFARFVDEGGYARRELWTDAGWAEATRPERPWPGARPPAGSEALPVTRVTAHEAAAYARWRGRRLPTEREWVLAACFDPASGRERRFPWGDEPPAGDALQVFRALRPVGASRLDSSPWGALDMAFNAAEWVWEGGAVVRGLSARFFPQDLAEATLDWRRAPGPGLRHPAVGFRCALDVPAPPPFEERP